jgi:hypothetical protein
VQPTSSSTEILVLASRLILTETLPFWAATYDANARVTIFDRLGFIL